MDILSRLEIQRELLSLCHLPDRVLDRILSDIGTKPTGLDGETPKHKCPISLSEVKSMASIGNQVAKEAVSNAC